MDMRQQNSASRKGQFLWMEQPARSVYLQNLKQKISDGYYFSDNVLSKVADDLAPILEEITLYD